MGCPSVPSYSCKATHHQKTLKTHISVHGDIFLETPRVFQTSKGLFSELFIRMAKGFTEHTLSVSETGFSLPTHFVTNFTLLFYPRQSTFISGMTPYSTSLLLSNTAHIQLITDINSFKTQLKSPICHL